MCAPHIGVLRESVSESVRPSLNERTIKGCLTSMVCRASHITQHGERMGGVLEVWEDVYLPSHTHVYSSMYLP